MVKILNPADFPDLIHDFISFKKQSASPPFFDLTVKKLRRVKTGGSLDFGGSEFAPGRLDTCLPVKQQPEDAYGWWKLHEGYYLVEFNEHTTFGEHRICQVQAHPNLLLSGGSHPTLLVATIDQDFLIPLWVPKFGLQLKQNARISRMIIYEY